MKNILQNIKNYVSEVSGEDAAIILHRIGLADKYFEKREYVKNYYNNAFKNNSNIKLLNRSKYSKGNNHKYVIFVKDRNNLMKHLKDLKVYLLCKILSL